MLLAGRPDSIALKDGATLVTYRDLSDRVRTRTEQLAGVAGPGRLVAVQRPKSLGFAVDALAVLECGGVVVPLDPAGPPGRIASLRALIDPHTTITAEGVRNHPAARSRDLPSDAAYVFATSGSTGRPKPVLGSRSALVAYLDFFSATFPGSGERHGSVTGLGFDVLIRDLFQPLRVGATVVIPGVGEVPGPRWIAEKEISALNAVPSLVRSWLRHADGPCTSVRSLYLAGEPVTGELVRALPRLFPALGRLVNFYGTTETALPKFHHVLAPGSAPDGVLPAGRPVLAETEARLDDGEVVLVSAHCALGYLDRPDLTAERFMTMPDGRTAYRTGDRGRFTEDGMLVVQGRVDDEVKINGVRTHPAEVAAALRKHVHDAFVLGERDTEGRQRLIAFVQAEPSLDVAALRMALLESLPAAAIPSRVTVLPDGIPRLPNGKPDRAALLARQPAKSGVNDESSTPRGRKEAIFIALWKEILAVPVDATTDFFVAGGDSLAAQLLIARVRSELGAELGFRTLLSHPTPRSLAQVAIGPPAASTAPTRRSAVTAVQRRLHFLQELDPEDTSYVLIRRIRVRGALDTDRVRQAVAVLLDRHTELRTRFPTVNGEPRTLIDPAPETPFHVVAAWPDLTPRKFDLAQELPVRVQLLREHADQAILQFSIHHIVSDARSNEILLDEFFAAYRGLSLPDVPLAEEPVQIDLEGRLPYWRHLLAGAPAILELSGPRPRTESRSTAAGRVVQRLEADAVRHAAAVLGTTPFALLVTAFSHVLGRHGGTDDVVLGTAVSTRDSPETDSRIGCHIDTLVLRLAQSREGTIRELVAANADAAADARDHLVPFDTLVQALRPDRDPSAPPLVQVLFTFHGDRAPETGSELRADVLPVPVGGAKLDLTCTVLDNGSGFECEIVHAADVVDASVAERIAEHFAETLAAMVTDIDGPVTALPPAPARDRVFEPRIPPAAGPAPLLHQRFQSAVHDRPDQVAVRCRGTALTYADLDRRAGALARHLRDKGVRRNSRIGLLLDRSTDLIVAMLGVVKSGAAYVPLDPMHPVAHTAAVLAEAGATSFVTHDEVPDRPDLPAIVLDDIDWNSLDDTPFEADVRADDVMYVMFTSGSTGRPKGVVVEHGHVAAYLSSFLRLFGLRDGLCYATLSTFAADLGLTNVLCALGTGGTLIVVPYEDATDPVSLASLLRTHPVDFVKLVPSHLKAMREAGVLADVLPRRHLVLAGEPCPPDLVRSVQETDVGCTVWNNYGPTETTVSVLAHRAEDPVGDTVPLGKPLPHARVDVVDSALRPVPLGTPGELLISGASVARGYTSSEDDAGRFIEHPWTAGLRAYKSGDLARIGVDGAVEYLGRTDRQVKIRGYRVEPGHVEAALLRHSAVAEAAVVARPGPDGRARLVAYWVPAGDGSGLSSFARSTLASHLVPSAFVPLTRLPFTPNGKLDESALPAPASSAASSVVAPRDDTERRLADMWCDLLGLDGVGIDDDFFDLGGDSFTAMRMARDVPGLRVVTVFQRPTIRSLAEVLRGDADDGLLVRLRDRPAGSPPDTTVVAVPFGGGNASTYRELAAALPEEIDMLAVSLPGHDLGAADQPLIPFPDLVDAVVREVRADVTGPVVVYGHCLGAAVAVAVAHRLVSEGTDVLGVAVGGALPAPRLPGRFFELLARVLPSDRWTSDRLYRDTLRGIGGMAEELGPDDLAFVLRAVRHDSREAEKYYSGEFPGTMPTPGSAPLPALCIAGEWDRITEFHEERHREWDDYGLATGSVVIRDAGHFFQRDQAEILARLLTRWCESRLTDREGSVPDGDFADAPTREGVVGRRITTGGRLRAFAAVSFAQAVSMIGTRAVAFALGVWLFLRTGSVSDFATTLVCSVLPGLLVLPIAGAAADRWNRRLVMVVGDVAALLGSVLCLGALLAGELRLWHIGVAAALGSVGTAFSQPAFIAATAQLVPKRYLSRVNGMSQALVAVSQVVGPLLGGALLVPLGLTGLLALDIGTIVLSLGILCLIRFPDLMFRKREETVWEEIAGGARYIFRRPPMRAMVVFFLGYNFLLGVGLALLPTMTLSFATPSALGTVTMVGAAGGVAAGLALALWGGFARRATGMVGFVLLTGVGMTVAGLRPSVVFVTCGMLCVTFSLAMINGHWLTLIQAKVGPELQGRVVAFNRMIANVTEPLGYVIAGVAADSVASGIGLSWWGDGQGRDMGLLLVIVGMVLTALGVAGLRWHRLYRMEDLLPDHIPHATASWDRDELQRRADMQTV